MGPVLSRLQELNNTCCGRALIRHEPRCEQARGKRGATAEQRAPARLVCIRHWLQRGLSLARPCPLCTCIQTSRYKF